MNTFSSKFVVVDLETGATDSRVVDEHDLKLFGGGGGIGAKLFIDDGDDETIVVANGLLTGFTVPAACKTSFLFRSPLTGVFGEASVGGHFGAQLKRTGVDGLIIRGRSSKPVYLYVSDGAVEIRDASHLWGLDTFESQRRLTDELPKGAKVGVIGPAGERGVRFASVMFDGEFSRAAGRTGIGCMFGRKRIKGLAVQGNSKPVGRDQKELIAYVRELNKSIKQKSQGFHMYGTTGAVARREKSGDLPIKNFSQGVWDGAEKISGNVYVEQMLVKHDACFACPIACGKRIEIKSGTYKGMQTSRPEYETTAALGSNLLNDSPEGVAVANMLCNKYGLDTISTGVLLGFIFECLERDLVTDDEMGLQGIEAQWGDNDAIQELIRMIAYREGIGDLLAEGVRIAAERIGSGSDRFAIHAKGLELPMHDPRALVSTAATYATGNRGGSHNESFAHYLEEGVKVRGMDFPDEIETYTSKGKGEITAKMQNWSSAYDALGLCKFLVAGGVGLEDLTQLVRLTLGWEITERELLEIGERIFTLKRLYNQRLGLSGADDTLAVRILDEKRGQGGAAENLPDLKLMLADLYAFRGWDEQGRVRPDKARELGLEDYL